MAEQDRRNQLRTGDLAQFIIGSTSPGELGKTKLFKTMWWADVLHYRRYGETVSGLSAYVRMPKGPVPKNIYPILRDLKAAGKILERQVNLGEAVRHEFIAIAPADPDRFTSREIQSIYRAIDLVRPLTAAQASDMTYGPVWCVLGDGEDMPVRAAAVVPGDVTPEDMELVLQHRDDFGNEHIEAA